MRKTWNAPANGKGTGPGGSKEAVRSQKGKGPNGVDGVALLEVADYQAGKIPLGFAKSDLYKRSVTNPDGKVDEFYYSSINYKKPDGDLGNYWTWSSSLFPSNSDYAFYFDGGNGYVDFVFSRDVMLNNGSARCVGASGMKR